jgi:hypothetical protein
LIQDEQDLLQLSRDIHHVWIGAGAENERP